MAYLPTVPAWPDLTGPVHQARILTALEMARNQQKILNQATDEPTFENTVIALERLLMGIRNVHEPFAMAEAFDSTEDLQAAKEALAEPLSRFYAQLFQDDVLYRRVTLVQNDLTAVARYTAEDCWLVAQMLERFERHGVHLSPEDKLTFQTLHADLERHQIAFGKTVLAANQMPFWVETDADLEGLTDAMIDDAAQWGNQLGRKGKWAFPLGMAPVRAALEASKSPTFRRDLWQSSQDRCKAGTHDTRSTIQSILRLRSQLARLMGYENWAQFNLSDQMAGTPERAEALLMKVWGGAKAKFQQEADQVQQAAQAAGHKTPLNPGDWHHFVSRVQQTTYAFDAQELAAYLPRDRVRAGIFEVMGQLFGLRFERDDQLPVFADRVDAYQVWRDAEFVGVLYVDDFSRPTKSGGAWMEVGQSASHLDARIYPVVGNALNLTDSGENPKMTMEEVITALHELGHGLHGLLSTGRYPSQSGTQVPTDFVEFPSQLLENWAGAPDVLKRISGHIDTGEAIPDALFAQWKAASSFNTGFLQGEYLLSALVDLRLHQLDEKGIEALDLEQFMQNMREELGCPPMLTARYDPTHFTHIFQTDYSARYYAYLWAEVLDADVFSVFEQEGLFHPERAAALMAEVYERGHTRPVMESFIAWMGREPDPAALMRRKGF